MARNMKFNVVAHPTKETPGRTIMGDEFVLENGAVKLVEMGELVKVRGAAGFDAFSYTDDTKTATKDLGHFDSRSQAGHAIRQDYEADERAAKRAAKTAKTSAPAALTIEQVAEKLGISRGAALKRANRGTSVVKVDGGYRLAE